MKNKLVVTQAAVLVATALAVAIVACGTDATSGSSCAEGELQCGANCVEPLTDPANCGGCGTACAGAQLCSQGTCSLTCSPGTTQCNSSCVDVNVDPKNCGACGKLCMAGQICKAGACAAQCPSPLQTLCVGDGGAVSCVTTTTDSANCGSCGNVCAPGKVCTGGTCSDSCGSGETFCPPGDGGAAYCSLTQSDQANCGGCGKACATGLVCSGGSCAAQCTPPLQLCGTQCIDPQADTDNCGGCGKAVCKGAKPTCSSGVCVTGVTYNQSMPSGTVLESDARCVAWHTFQAALTGSYNNIKISGSNDPAGKTCTGAAATQICNALHKNLAVSGLSCGGRTWNVGNCSGSSTYESELSANGSTCNCDTPGYTARPCIGNLNWGGINTATCSPPSQTLVVTCF